MNPRGLRVGPAGKKRFFDLSAAGGVPEFLPSVVSRYVALGASTWTAPSDGIVEVFAIAAGGGGRGSNQAGAAGGGGGGAGRFYPVRVKAGDQISMNIGTAGAGATSGAAGSAAATTVTMPDGRVGTANGGGGATSNVAWGLGGTASGFDENAAGGRGGRAASTPVNSVAGENNGGPTEDSGANASNAPGGGGGGVGTAMQTSRQNSQQQRVTAEINRAGNGGHGNGVQSAGPGFSALVCVTFVGFKP